MQAEGTTTMEEIALLETTVILEATKATTTLEPKTITSTMMNCVNKTLKTAIKTHNKKTTIVARFSC